ncbi:MAG: DUF3846 domain-containing protein [Myxococcota bacterium]
MEDELVVGVIEILPRMLSEAMSVPERPALVIISHSDAGRLSAKAPPLYTGSLYGPPHVPKAVSASDVHYSLLVGEIGGRVDVFPLAEGIDLWLNHEALYLTDQENRWVPSNGSLYPLMGPGVIVGLNQSTGDARSHSESELAIWMERANRWKILHAGPKADRAVQSLLKGSGVLLQRGDLRVPYALRARCEAGFASVGSGPVFFWALVRGHHTPR